MQPNSTTNPAKLKTCKFELIPTTLENESKVAKKAFFRIWVNNKKHSAVKVKENQTWLLVTLCRYIIYFLLEEKSITW